MGKIRDIFRGPRRYFAWFVVVTTGLFLVFWLVGSGNTFIHWAKAGIEIRCQEKLMRDYEMQNAEMDRRTLEKFAREQFNFAIPGEDVYVLD